MSQISRSESREFRHRRVRRKIVGTAARPRMALMVSNRHLYIQFIDDAAGRTLAAVSTAGADGVVNKTVAESLGRTAAEKAIAAGIKQAVVDRGGFKFHGRIKAAVDAVVAGGVAISAKEAT